MKSGPALHKLAKHRIELLQQKLNEADSEAAIIRDAAQGLENTIVQERALAAQSDFGLDFDECYARRCAVEVGDAIGECRRKESSGCLFIIPDVEICGPPLRLAERECFAAQPRHQFKLCAGVLRNSAKRMDVKSVGKCK